VAKRKRPQRSWDELAEAFDAANAKQRPAVVREMVELDAARTEKLVEKALRVAKRAQQPALAKCLVDVGTPTAVVAGLVAGAGVRGYSDAEVLRAVLVYIAGRAEAGDDELRGLVQRSRIVERYEPECRDETRSLALLLVRRAYRDVVRVGAILLTKIDGAMAAFDAIDRLGVRLDVDLALEVWKDAPSDERVAIFATYLPDEGNRRAVVYTITKNDDPAWATQLLPYIDEPEVMRALGVLGHAPTAERLRKMAIDPSFDLRTRNACHLLGTIGDPQATPILLYWLRDEAGAEAAPMLLVALGSCGTADAIPVLEELRESQPKRAGFFNLAIAEIRARTAAVVPS
jgi:HEAT repeat protein